MKPVPPCRRPTPCASSSQRTVGSRLRRLPNAPNVGGGGGGGTGDGLNLPGVNRAQLGKGYQEAQPIDPFGLASHGLDTGLGTMLLQGVAEVR